MSKLVKLRDGTWWDRCRTCGKLWTEVTHSAKGQCRTDRRLKREIDSTIRPVQPRFEILGQDLQDLVLKQETLDQKGYSVTSLTRGSTKKIIHKCDVCGLPKETPFKLFVAHKGLSHPQCKTTKTHITNLERYGVNNTYNIPDFVKKRFLTKEKEIEEEVTAEGYQVIKVDHGVGTRRDIVVRFICPQNHKHKITWKAWKVGQRCGRCYGNNGKITYDLIRDAFVLEGYQLITTDYENNNTKLSYVCPNGHQNETSWKIWERGHRCPKCCTNSTSQAEEEIRQIFSSYRPIKTRKIIPPKELDIYFPNHKVAIEYCGLYWHSSDKHERIGVSYHHKKRMACLERGVRLITLFDDEWQKHKDICISRINNALGAIGRRIYARQCKIQDVEKGEANTFFVTNHLQGAGGAEKTLGLYYENELVYALSLRKPTRQHTAKGAIEIKRMAPILNTLVVGGASRLFKKACEYAKQKGYQKIISYCDKRWGNGGVYRKLGMTMVRETNYTPALTNGKKRKSVQTYSGKEFPKGWYKIYDCGHQVWTLEI